MNYLIILSFFVSSIVFSNENRRRSNQPQRAPATENEQTSSVIDFEGDVIEGERKRPYIFIQTGGDPRSLDSMLYKRSDFNDFHEVDKKRRPSFIPSKKQRK